MLLQPYHAASGASLTEFIFYNLLRSNIIVKIRTGKVNEMEFLKLFLFWGGVGRPTACILWTALVSSLPATTKKDIVDVVMG